MKVKASQRERILAPEGVHNARCIQVIDLGTQESKMWGSKRKLQLAFELVDESAIFNEDKGEENFVLYRNYTMSLAPKASLTKDISSWLNKKFSKSDEFDLIDLLNAPCQIQVKHNESEGEVYANISAIMAPRKGDKIAKAQNEHITLFLEDGEFDQESFDSLPGFIREKISITEEFKEVGGEFEKEDADEKPAKKSSKSSKPAKAEKPARKSRR